MKSFFCLFCLFLMFSHLTACSSHPLSMPDEEWAALTPHQKMEAREKQATIDLERQKLAVEREEKYLEHKKQQRKQVLEQDIAKGLIAEFHPENYVCFGGDKCRRRNDEEKRNEIVISLRALANIDYIQIYADDRYGSKHDGVLGVNADHYRVEIIDLSKRTKWYKVFVGRIARNIVLKAETDDEIRLFRLKVFGSKVPNEQLQYQVIE
ncbi:MAG: hypothetical protein BA863_07680 [Desulfovibrio sp. S3730MH75]|nr:MAG: hypothetical protein BA863_07680 [Desulfovibrio sp. S3730MH75]